MSKVLHVEQQNFEAEVLRSEIPVVVDFYATWCPPCRALGPILDSLAEHFDGRIKFVKINSDDEQELARTYKVTALPTVIMFNGGEVAGQFSGLPAEATFQNQLEQWIKTPQVTN